MQDRGTIKWTSIMMPEHIEMLKEVKRRQNYKQKPVLDEQELEEINMKLQLAIHNDLSIEVKYYVDHDYHYVDGKLRSVDVLENCLQLDDFTRIKLEDVLDVKIS